MTRIAILGDFNPLSKAQAATSAAIDHAAGFLGTRIETEWIPTERAYGDFLESFSALWIAPGSPYRNLEGALRAIRRARETQMPCLGTCGGFQHMVLEYARTVLGQPDAAHGEYEPSASNLFISPLACSLVGREMRIRFSPGSKVRDWYGSESATEEYYCTFGLNPEKVPLLKGSGLRISGSDSEGESRVVEIADHPYFIGTLFVPQTRSAPGNPHPVIVAFARAAAAPPP